MRRRMETMWRCQTTNWKRYWANSNMGISISWLQRMWWKKVLMSPSATWSSVWMKWWMWKHSYRWKVGLDRETASLSSSVQIRNMKRSRGTRRISGLSSRRWKSWHLEKIASEVSSLRLISYSKRPSRIVNIFKSQKLEPKWVWGMPNLFLTHFVKRQQSFNPIWYWFLQKMMKASQRRSFRSTSKISNPTTKPRRQTPRTTGNSSFRASICPNRAQHTATTSFELCHLKASWRRKMQKIMWLWWRWRNYTKMVTLMNIYFQK